MRFIVAYVTAVTLVAGGLTYAQSRGGANNQGSMNPVSGSSTEMAPCNSGTTDIQGDLRVPKDGGMQSVGASPTRPEDGRPRAMGTPSGVKEGRSASADARDTGVWTGRRSSDEIDTRLGATPSSIQSEYRGDLRDDAGTAGARPDK